MRCNVSKVQYQLVHQAILVTPGCSNFLFLWGFPDGYGYSKNIRRIIGTLNMHYFIWALNWIECFSSHYSKFSNICTFLFWIQNFSMCLAEKTCDSNNVYVTVLLYGSLVFPLQSWLPLMCNSEANTTSHSQLFLLTNGMCCIQRLRGSQSPCWLCYKLFEDNSPQDKFIFSELFLSHERVVSGLNCAIQWKFVMVRFILWVCRHIKEKLQLQII